MKNLLLSLFIIFLGSTVIISCTKMDLNNPSTAQNLNSAGKVKPNVPQCGVGYTWDYYLGKCVPICPSGYHNDSITGACVVNGGGTPKTINVIKNPNNPEEIVGQTHNAGMTSIMVNFYDGNLEPTEQNVFAYTKLYLQTQNYDTVTINNAYNYDLQNFGPIYQETNLTSITNMMYNSGSISLSAKNYLLQLANLISGFTIDSTSIPTQASYNSFANNLIANENQMSSDLSLTENDKYILFSGYSVARYSIVYAVNYAIALSSPSQMLAANNSNLHPELFASWFSWGKVAGGDVVGAVAGGLGGAAAGSLAGGVGAGPGAAAGALGGAISGSVYEAGMQLWNHFF